MTTKLTEEQFKATLTDKMVDVTMAADAVVDIWPYVRLLTVDNEVSAYVFDRQLVEKVYRNRLETFDHVLLPTDNSNIFIAIIIDLGQRRVAGHFRLDLNKEYGRD